MATYDLPAIIDYILDTTGQEQLYCVCHSMGSTTVLALLADQQEYNNKVSINKCKFLKNSSLKTEKLELQFFFHLEAGVCLGTSSSFE